MNFSSSTIAAVAFMSMFAVHGFSETTAPQSASLPPEVSRSVSEAKAILKDHLKYINKVYPFQDWTRELEKARMDLEGLKAAANRRPVDPSVAKQFGKLDKQFDSLRKRRPEVQKLINEMYVQVVAFRVEEKFRSQSKVFQPEAKTEFIRQLKPYEAGSLQSKTAFLGSLAALETSYGSLRANWMNAYAENFLAKRIESQLQGFDLQKNESLYDAYTLQLEYWRGRISINAVQASSELRKMGEKWKTDRFVVQGILGKLTDVFNTDMLFSELLAAASKDGVDFPLEVEEKMESELKSRQAELIIPIEQRKMAWNSFQADLKMLMEKAEAESEQSQMQSLAAAEELKREQEQLAALEAEKERLEKEQRERFKQTLNALKTFTFKGETTVDLDADASKALSTESGFLKSSYVGSGQKTLKVGKPKFSDTLAFVDKFSMAEESIDLSKMSLENKTSQSAYVYTSPAGRTSNEDLQQFVSLVALGSFETGYTFFSYVPSGNVRVGSRMQWIQDKAGQKLAEDRSFSYVDLVVDAHKVYHGRMKAGESKSVVRSVNVPANMIIFFNDQGGIKRFQSFSDTYEISISASDLTSGKLYYKFLNYSTDRRNIYLNGIDPEIKVASTRG
jgi:cell division septum initiation protein DivIVA